MTTPAQQAPDRGRAEFFERSPSSPIVFAFLAIAIAIVLFTLYTLWKFWPTAAVLASTRATTVHWLWITRDVTTEVRLFVIVAVCGALGGLLHATRSFAWYVGHSSLKWRWLPYYMIMMFVGAGLATIVYVVVRGGIVSAKASSSDINPYGFAAIAAIVGLFSEQALEMLRRVATDFFAQAPSGNDQAQATSTDDATGTTALAPVATTGQASLVTATSATLGGSITPNGDATTYHFDYGLTADYGTSTADEQVAGSGDASVPVSADLTTLIPGTLYHFRVVAANAVDIVNGTDETFTTTAV